MVEFIKPFLALSILALIAGFVVTFDGVTRDASTTTSSRTERALADKLASTVGAHVLSKDTLLDSDDLPVQLYHLDTNAFSIVKIRPEAGDLRSAYLVLFDSSGKPVSAYPVSTRRSFSERYLLAYGAQSGIHQSFRLQTSPTPAESLSAAIRSQALRYSRLAVKSEGAHADR